MENLATVIIPVYNAERFLDRCVTTLLRQTHPSLQIVLVNDASPDKSGELCDRLARAHPETIQVIHMEKNGGPSAARNAGLDRAKGQWIAFVDADDFVSERYIAEMIAICKQHGCDGAICHYVAVEPQAVVDEDRFSSATHVQRLTNRDAVIRHFGKDADALNMVGGRLFHASLWENLRFPEGMINEDLYISHHILYRVKQLAFTNARLYAYCQSPASLMRRPFSLQRLDALNAYYEAVRYYEEVGETSLADIGRRVYCNRLFDACGIVRRELPAEKDVQREIRLRAIEAYKEVRRIPSYVDISPSKRMAYRLKQAVGRYLPGLYNLLFLKGRNYI